MCFYFGLGEAVGFPWHGVNASQAFAVEIIASLPLAALGCLQLCLSPGNKDVPGVSMALLKWIHDHYLG